MCSDLYCSSTCFVCREVPPGNNYAKITPAVSIIKSLNELFCRQWKKLINQDVAEDPLMRSIRHPRFNLPHKSCLNSALLEWRSVIRRSTCSNSCSNAKQTQLRPSAADAAVWETPSCRRPQLQRNLHLLYSATRKCRSKCFHQHHSLNVCSMKLVSPACSSRYLQSNHAELELCVPLKVGG